MALRDQPYLPLYIKDIMTDEKLNECSAATHGIYIKGIMCLMHKSETYGKILLKQKHKQNESKEKNFALLLAKHLPYSELEIERAITELISEGVCFYDGDYLVQKRMVKDNEISEKRALAGKTGGKNTQKNTSKDNDFAQAKVEAKGQANSEYEYEYEYENIIDIEREDKIKEASLIILKDFNFTETKNFNKLSQISIFVRLLFAQGRFDYFREQYPAYLKYKKQSGAEKQSLDTFLNEGWDREVWTEKLKEHVQSKSKSREVKQQSVADIRAAARSIIANHQSENGS